MSKNNSIAVNSMDSILEAAAKSPIGTVVTGATRAIANMAREVFRRHARTDIVVDNASTVIPKLAGSDGELCIPSSSLDIAKNIQCAADGANPAPIMSSYPLVKVYAATKVIGYSDVLPNVGQSKKGTKIICDNQSTARHAANTARLLKRLDLTFAVAEQ